MSAAELPRITDPELIRVAAEPTSSTEYVVQVDVLDAVLPDLLRASVADDATWQACMATLESYYWVRRGGAFAVTEDDVTRDTAHLAELLRQHSVGVLHLTPGAADGLATDLIVASDAPDRCEVGPCDLNSEADFAGMCRIHDNDADDLPPSGE